VAGPLQFEISAKDQDPTSKARVGRVTTLHGSFDTPAFMPVGTQGSVKGVLPDQIRETGAQIILGNTYHLMLRPGSELIAEQGGLQHWTRWQGPMLTDSGGFQVFSLTDTSKIDDDGVTFRSHINGSKVVLTPERSMQIQNELGADIMMAFDDCPPAPENPPEDSEHDSGGSGDSRGTSGGNSGGSSGGAMPRHAVPMAEYQKRLDLANERTLRWLDRCMKSHGRPGEQSLFPIVQGGTDLAKRTWCAERVLQHETPGYAIGGVAVGEGFDEIRKVVQHTAPLLPENKPRYLMGVGYERDIVSAVRSGVDMFDCVLPTRNARNAWAFTPTGSIKLTNAKHANDSRPLDETCPCPVCRGGYSRSYLRHMFMAKEMLGPILVTLHNLTHFQRLMLDIRAAINDNAWLDFARQWPVAAEGLSIGT